MTERAQRIWARVAGFLFLWLIATGVAGMMIMSRIAGSGTFAETARRIAESEHLYRAALCCELMETMSALILAFALYATLRTADESIAQFAMFWRLGESLIGAVGVVIGFGTLHVNTAQADGVAATAQLSTLAALGHHAGSAATNISASFFSIGSLLFFYLFFKSRYIPRILSAFGMVASVIVTAMLFGSLAFPEHAATLQYGWAPMALAEMATGIWLMVFAVRRSEDASSLQ